MQNVQTGLNINTIHSNTPFNYTTSRNFSRPPLQPILTNPLIRNLKSTYSNHTQQSTTDDNRSNSLNNTSPPSSQTSITLPLTLQNSQFQIPNPPSTTIRTNPYFHNTSTTSFTNISNGPTYHTVQPSTKSQNTIPQPTYINSFTSISGPIKPFDGLDHNYPPENSLQNIEARVTFSLGLQPTSEHEYKFWHARRMAFIQCSLTGTALSWYIRLNDTFKQDWHAFVQAFKKQFSSQNNAYYAQVEALNLSKKDNETVRHFALNVQQLVEKGWCNENASTINLKCNEIFTRGPPKKLKDFANKRQVKHTSTILENSIPFHTLVKLVDAEHIANDKIRTYDLAHEINNITEQLNTQTLEPSSQEQLMFTQSKDPNNKNKPAYKNIVPPVIEQITPFLLPSKINEMIKTNEMLLLDQNLHKNHLYSTFDPPLMIEQNTMILDIAVEVLQVIIPATKTIHKTDTVLHLEKDLVTIKVLLLHNTLDNDMILVNVIHGLTTLHRDLRIDLVMDKTLAVDLDYALIQEKTTFQNTQIHTDHLSDQEILDFLDPVHTPTLKTKSN